MLAGRNGARGRCLRTATIAPALATLSTSCLCFWTTRAWSLQPVMLRQEFFTKEIRRLLHGGENGSPSRSSTSEGWSQSPVLPWAQRAYETCLSAGSTAGACARPPLRAAIIARHFRDCRSFTFDWILRFSSGEQRDGGPLLHALLLLALRATLRR